MGKKLLIGCAVVAVIAIVGGGIAGYFLVYKPGKEYLTVLTQDAAQVSELNQEVENRSPFTPPDTGQLEEPQVEKFVRVQRLIVERVGGRLAELKAKYENLGGSGRPKELGITDILSLWGDLKQTYFLVKQTQVEGLNQENLSLDEYAWIRSRFYQALGAEFFSVNLDKMAEAVRQQNPEMIQEVEDRGGSIVSEEERQLVRPYQEEASQWMTYAWLGV